MGFFIRMTIITEECKVRNVLLQESVLQYPFGKIIKEAYKAADILEKEGVSIEIIDLRTIRPMDHEAIINSVKKTNRLVILEEAWPFGSISSEITFRIQDEAFDYLDAPIKRITTADTPAPYSPVLLEEWMPMRDLLTFRYNR